MPPEKASNIADRESGTRYLSSFRWDVDGMADRDAFDRRPAGHRALSRVDRVVALHRRLADAPGGARARRSGGVVGDAYPGDRPDQASADHRPEGRVSGERLRFAVLTRRPPERLRTIDGGGNGLFNWGTAADNLKLVGPNSDKNDPWGWDGAHQPQAFFPQYILTGDPFYLEEMEFWASITAFNCWGGTNNMGQGCGPYPSTTVYGGALNDQMRGVAWTSRNRAEAAFAEPDGSPFKTYLTALVDEMIQRWEGGLKLTGTPFDGLPEKVWAQGVGNQGTVNAGAFSGQVPPLHNWESICDPTVPFANCIADPSWLNSTVAGSFSEPWFQWYLQYALGRIYELGYADQAAAAWAAPYPIGMINDSGMPTAVALYDSSPLQRGTAGWFTTWAGWLSAINFSGCCGTAGFQGYFAGNLASDGRQVWLTPGLAMLVDEAQPGAVRAWSWWIGNVYSKVPDFANDPKWAIVPRTDTNVLPPH